MPTIKEYQNTIKKNADEAAQSAGQIVKLNSQVKGLKEKLADQKKGAKSGNRISRIKNRVLLANTEDQIESKTKQARKEVRELEEARTAIVENARRFSGPKYKLTT
jgi:hypothetical protein